MNQLPLDLRVRILDALVEGNSVRGTPRIVGVDKKTALKLLVNVGDASAAYQDDTLRALRCERLELNEIWSFCHAKERNLPAKLRGAEGAGDMWTWTPTRS